MSQTNSSSRRNFATAWLATSVFAVTLSAQQVTPPAVTPVAAEEPVVQLERFTVTGTNIKRLDQEKTLPVTVLDQQAMEARDASQASDLLSSLSQVTGMPGNETATLGATARGDNATISLRGIPSSNTLVLLNGRRLAPHPISQGEAGVPTLSTNVNQLPNRGLDRIDVLRDGASSIYGTDAVAGVVNYLTRRSFVGSELQLRYGTTKLSDGEEYRATLTHGFEFAGGKGHGLVTVDYYDRAAMFARDRDFSAEADNSYRAPAPWNTSNAAPSLTAAGQFNSRSVTSEYGSYILGTITATDAFGSVTGFTGARPAGVPATLASASGVFFLAPNGTPGGAQILNATPSRLGVTSTYYWNNDAYRVIQPETQRTTIFASGDYELNSRLAAFADLSLYRADSLTIREPDGITQSTDGFIIVPVTNPFNPFGNRFWSTTGAANTDGTPRLTGTPSAVSITNKRLTDLMSRTASVTSTVYRGVAGLRGKLFDTWSWEGALLFSEATTDDDEEGPSRKSLIKAAINQTDPLLTFNPFTRTFAVQNGTLVVTGDYRNPEFVQNSFRSSFVRSGVTTLGSGDLRASGELWPIWGGNTIGAAVGGEYRYEGYDDSRPPFAGLNPAGSGLDLTSNDFLGFSPNSDTHGTRRVLAAYAEVVVPLVGNKFKLPLVRSLELSASARFESYSDFGDTTKPKLGLNWRPASWVLVRGSYNEGFHAPNLAQLFTGTLIRTVTGSRDTYREAVTGLPSDGASNRRSVASGNPDLQPEEAKGKSAGLVVEVPMVKGLSFGVDYWEIAQTNVITSPTAASSVADDNQALNAATQAALAAGQTIGAIDLGSGTASYQGDSSIVRLAVTQADRDAFALFNSTRSAASQKAVVGAIDILRATYFNKASQFVNGLDFDLTYRFPKLTIGNFTFNTTWTKLIDFHAYNAAGASRTNLLWTNSASVGGATPQWRGSATLSWRRQDWNASISAYYIGDYSDVGATTDQGTYDSLGKPNYIVPVFTNGSTVYRFRVGDSMSYNASVSYRIRSTDNKWLNDTTVRVGVVNLFNAVPPLSSDGRGYDPAIYNLMARGQAWSVQITKKL